LLSVSEQVGLLETEQVALLKEGDAEPFLVLAYLSDPARFLTSIRLKMQFTHRNRCVAAASYPVCSCDCCDLDVE